MHTTIVQSDFGHFSASRLVALALDRPETRAVYSVFNYIELMATPTGATKVLNKHIAMAKGLSESTISKALRKLSDLGIIALEYPPDGNKAERVIRYASRLGDATVAALTALLPEELRISTPSSTAVPEGSAFQCSSHQHSNAGGDQHWDELPIKAVNNAIKLPVDKCNRLTKTKKTRKTPPDGGLPLFGDSVDTTAQPLDVVNLAWKLLQRAGIERPVAKTTDLPLLRARLKRFSPDQLLRAVELAAQNAAWDGVDDRGAPYRDLRTVCWSDATVQNLLDGVAVDPASVKLPADMRDDVLRVYRAWRDAMQYPRASLTDERVALIRKRLAEGFTVDDFERVIRKIAQSAWHRGQNPEGRRYDDFANFAGSRSKFERNLASADVRGPVDRRFTHLAASDAPVVGERY